MKRLLSVSADVPLLRTRHLLLQQIGYEVISRRTFVAQDSHEAEERFDLLVVDYTIPNEERGAMIAKFRAFSGSPIIAVFRRNDPPVKNATWCVDEELQNLLPTVLELLGRN